MLPVNREIHIIIVLRHSFGPFYLDKQVTILLTDTGNTLAPKMATRMTFMASAFEDCFYFLHELVFLIITLLSPVRSEANEVMETFYDFRCPYVNNSP